MNLASPALTKLQSRDKHLAWYHELLVWFSFTWSCVYLVFTVWYYAHSTCVSFFDEFWKKCKIRNNIFEHLKFIALWNITDGQFCTISDATFFLPGWFLTCFRNNLQICSDIVERLKSILMLISRIRLSP